MDDNRIDSHKLMYHPHEVSKWLKGEDIYPIYVEVSPVNFCNHKCTFCGLDYKKGKDMLESTKIIETLNILKNGGTKSIMYGGAGEPFLHKDLVDIICQTAEIGLDVGITTNGSLIKEKDMELLLKSCKWIKISMNAGDSDSYSKIHGIDDCHHVRNKMGLLGHYKKKGNYNCTLGTQALLLPENVDGIEQLIISSIYANFDYCVIKPYSQHLASKTTKYKDLDYSELIKVKDILMKHNCEEFEVIFRDQTMLNKDKEKTYDKCYSVPFFWAYIESDGNVWTCSCFLDKNDKFKIGNIKDVPFNEIWSNRNKDIDIDITQCRNNCRMEWVNRYLWELKNPHPHKNFI